MEDEKITPHEGRPDPTALTTSQLAREVTHLRELIESRLNAMDKAVDLLQEFANRQPTIAEVVAKVDEKFHGIEERFLERDRRFDVRDSDTKRALEVALNTSEKAVEAAFEASEKAVSAAFAAAKEAVEKQHEASQDAIAKSEGAFTKQIDQIGNIINSQAVTLDDKIADIRQRLGSVETRSITNGKGLIDYAGVILGIVAVVLLLGIFAGYMAFRTPSPTPVVQTQPGVVIQREAQQPPQQGG
jgi:hypothetical protein